MTGFVVAALGCRADGTGVSTTEPTTGPGIVYALASVNEVALPMTVPRVGNVVIEVRKGALTLGADSTYIYSLALRTSVNGGPATSSTTTMRGAFTRSSLALTLLQLSDTMFVGNYAPNIVSLQVVKAEAPGQRFVFVR